MERSACCHFFSSAVQFCMIVIGVTLPDSSGVAFMRNRPSRVTAYSAFDANPLACGRLDGRTRHNQTCRVTESAVDWTFGVPYLYDQRRCCRPGKGRRLAVAQGAVDGSYTVTLRREERARMGRRSVHG